MKNTVIMVAILVLASFLRLSNLDSNPPSLFSDEVDIGYQIKSLLATGKDYQGNPFPLQFHSFSDVRTSLPIYATTLVSQIPGISLDHAIRLTPAIFSILSIVVIYFLINNLFQLFKLNSKEKVRINPGIWGSLVLTLLPWHYTYSRTGFELSMLFFFVICGLFFYSRFLIKGKIKDLLLGLLMLSLTPMIYSTAKLSIIFYPFILALIPGSLEKFRGKKLSLSILILFIPLCILFLDGGAGKRFSEISIFTDPTISTETDFSRKADLGPKATVGSSPSIISKIAHNKIVFVGQTFVKNLFNPLSAGYLFIQGDTNPRHAVQGWGMLEKVLVIPLLLGLYKLCSGKQNRLLIFLGLLAISSIGPAALTRDGWNHSSRNFMLILPLLLVITTGLCHLSQFSILLTLAFLSLLIFECFLYFHTYWSHYPYDSQRDWHVGMKEVVLYAKNNSDKTVIISRKYEPPLIFFLYYTDYPPAKFQQLAKENSFNKDIDKKYNLEGSRFADTNYYFASLKETEIEDPFRIKNAVYLLTGSEMKETFGPGYVFPPAVVSLPSGEGLFYSVIPKAEAIIN